MLMIMIRNHNLNVILNIVYIYTFQAIYNYFFDFHKFSIDYAIFG